MTLSDLAAAIVDRISALEPLDTKHEGDRFAGHVAMMPPADMDRSFSVGFGLPTRNREILDPSEYVCRLAIAVVYVDGDGVLERIADDSVQIAEMLYELVGTAGMEDLYQVDVEEGDIHPGRTIGTLLTTRGFRVRYHRT